MRGVFDYDRAAMVLAEAIYRGDRETALRWGISERTIYRYRERMSRDDKLSDLVKEKRARLDRSWADKLPASIQAAIEFLQEAAQKANKTDPEVIHAIAGALKIQTEVVLTKDVLDARLARERGQAHPPDRPLAAAGGDGERGDDVETAAGSADDGVSQPGG